MKSAFDREDDLFLVLCGPSGRQALWPSLVPVPQGWQVLHGPAGQAGCLDHITRGITAAAPGEVLR
ncbi:MULTISPECIES: MbtH family NRPS accessory protein [Streptomyces]|uniref:MbtH family NRPS accessory protein n=1 Tax=Streptomyces TaxID=1883 RepID=UPI001E54C197|nr:MULTISPECIES: MbtH family NRPS accessory protein [Streptomyces]UFQ14056.1 MbtH family NRPS accessory protein [Streptomyces huasconensis]WCL83655.1 MbtH family NRPS accessory protein [Streptomyces sp. JCM 35825]